MLIINTVSTSSVSRTLQLRVPHGFLHNLEWPDNVSNITLDNPISGQRTFCWVRLALI